MSFPDFQQNIQFLTIQRYTLLQVGIELNAKNGKNFLKTYCKFIMLIGLIIYFIYGLLYFAILLDPIALSMCNQSILILLKMFTFCYKKDYFMELIREMNNLAKKANPKEYKAWLSENRFSELIAKIYFYTCWTAIGFSGIIPLVLMAYDYHKGNGVTPKLPYGGKFPYDNGGLLHFTLHYILSIIYSLSLIYMSVGLDTIYGWFIYNVSAHFRILRIKIKIAALKLQEGVCENFTQDMGSIVCYHMKILKFVKDINNIFGYILWAEVMLSCLQICFNISSLNSSADIANLPFNIFVILGVIVQLIIYCFGGEKVKTENDMLCMDLYLKFPWHKMSIGEKKLMLLPLLRSQMVSNLTGVFFEVDRSLLVYIVQTAFSYNALLSALNE